jgi:hypothetical protein
MSAIASIAARALPQNEFGGAASILDRIALNPQPLPPKESFGGSLASEVLDDWCGTVPKRFPPPPTPPLGGGLLDTANVNAVIDALRLRF